MRILVTGAGGFAGLHLVRELRRRGWTVHGLVRRPDQMRLLKRLGARPVLGDVTRPADLRRAVRLSRPDAAAHLAGVAFVPEAEKDPVQTRRVIVGGALNLAKALPPDCRLLLVSSGVVYGPVRGRRLPDESSPLRPRGFYAKLKAEAERKVRKMRPDVLIARPFNHAGPGQDPRFVVSDFARQIALIEADLQSPTMVVGDLSSRRSFADVRDVARACADLLTRGRPGRTYNVGGRAVTIRAILRGLKRLSPRGSRIRVASTRAKRRGTSCYAGSMARIRRETSWKPKISLSRTLRDVLSEWRRKEKMR